MPTIEHPTFYARADCVAAGHTDDFFRYVIDFPDAETGDVEHPVGHVALVEVTRDMIAEYASEYGALGGVTERRNLPPADWYIVRTDSDGFVWAMGYESQGDARADLAEAEELYSNLT